LEENLKTVRIHTTLNKKLVVAIHHISAPKVLDQQLTVKALHKQHLIYKNVAQT